MGLTKRQKTLCTVFVIGLIALVVDRVFLRPQGGPRAASADSTKTADASTRPSDNNADKKEPPRASVAERLNQFWPYTETVVEETRDPFALPVSWLDNRATGPAKTPDAAALFAAQHRLTAVVLDARESYVLVNDHFLVPGQSLDGFTLVSADKRSVVFEQGSLRAVLELVNP